MMSGPTAIYYRIYGQWDDEEIRGSSERNPRRSFSSRIISKQWRITHKMGQGKVMSTTSHLQVFRWGAAGRERGLGLKRPEKNFKLGLKKANQYQSGARIFLKGLYKMPDYRTATHGPLQKLGKINEKPFFQAQLALWWQLPGVVPGVCTTEMVGYGILSVAFQTPPL